MIQPNRRDFLALGLALPWAADLAAQAARADDGGGGLIVRSSMPLDAETPVGAFDQAFTPNDRFFVRSHFGPPATVLAPWRLEVEGLVDRPLSLSLADLDGLDRATIPAVLQCSGNGRAFFAPNIPGVGWERGAVGNAEWGGVRLVDVLNRAGVKAEARHIQMHGADTPPNPKTPAFFRSLPLARGLDRSTILATTMNGEPLPRLHGGPIRMIVPGWAGNHWIKWVRKLTLAVEEAPGFYQRTGYKIPLVPGPPGVDPKPADLVPVTTLNVKSLIARPLEGATLKPAPSRSGASPGPAKASSTASRSPPSKAPGNPPPSSAPPPPAPGDPGPTPGRPPPAATPSEPGPPTPPARRSPNPPPGTSPATSGTGSTESPARSNDRALPPTQARPPPPRLERPGSDGRRAGPGRRPGLGRESGQGPARGRRGDRADRRPGRLRLDAGPRPEAGAGS